MKLSEKLKLLKSISIKFANESVVIRNSILQMLAKKIEENRAKIIEANSIDQEYAKDLMERGELNQSLYERMRLNQAKIDQLKVYPETILSMDDPLKKITYQCEIDTHLMLTRETVPLGVLGIIFESRPEVIIQIASLAIKTGNSVILKGGSESKHTNLLLAKIVNDCLESFSHQGVVTLLQSREEVDEMLKLDMIDLIIPRGSNQFVNYVQKNTTIPVLGHTEGICHIFVDETADKKSVSDVIFDAKTDYPAACNALETLLIHKNFDRDYLLDCLKRLADHPVEIRLDQSLATEFQNQGLDFTQASEQDWSTEYCDLILSVKTVDTIDDAIEHINHYGSKHTESILTDQDQHWEEFQNHVDAASVFLNSSTRFSDGYVYGFGAEVGISTNKIHARGPVGVEGLLTYKYKLTGTGQIRSDYRQNKQFTHKKILS